MNKNYESEFKKKIVRFHLEEGRSLKGLATEYGVSKASIPNWTKQFHEECQTNEEANHAEVCAAGAGGNNGDPKERNKNAAEALGMSQRSSKQRKWLSL